MSVVVSNRLLNEVIRVLNKFEDNILAGNFDKGRDCIIQDILRLDPICREKGYYELTKDVEVPNASFVEMFSGFMFDAAKNDGKIDLDLMIALIPVWADKIREEGLDGSLKRTTET